MWFYHAVKQETASSIYYGFSTLFPSLLDRIQVMNRLLEDTSATQRDCSPTNKLLVPMLIPCFTSAKMLFQLMSESSLLFEEGLESAQVSTGIIVKFMDTLLDSLWRQTRDVLGGLEALDEKALAVKALELLENSNEFKCLNVFLRAAIYWCSTHTREGWQIIQRTCSKFVSFTLDIMQCASSIQPSRVVVLPYIIQHTFPGKLLPFTLLSVLSLPAVREQLPSILDDFWPQLEKLSSATHLILKCPSRDQASVLPTIEAQVQSGLEHKSSEECRKFDLSQSARISAELASCLSLSPGEMSTYNEIFKRIWVKTVSSPSFKSYKAVECQDTSELHRVSFSSDLMKLYGAETFVIEYSRGSDSVGLRAVEYNAEKISFNPSRTILSQHIYPPSSRKEAGCDAQDSSRSSPTTTDMVHQLEVSDLALKDSTMWLQDLQKILVWVGSHYAATLITGAERQPESVVDPRWAASPLFRGGLMSNADSQKQHPGTGTGRNELLLQQIIDNVGPGKKLVEKVRHALDPGSGVGGNNLHLKATRLKRQDSVDAAIEKSGGYEAVDRAVRGAFAVLLKHSNVYYMAEPLSKDGIPSEAIVDAWKSALQLRRW